MHLLLLNVTAHSLELEASARDARPHHQTQSPPDPLSYDADGGGLPLVLSLHDTHCCLQHQQK